MSVRIQATVDVEVTPEQLARAFWKMSSAEQARFFNSVADEADFRFPFQLQHITEEDGLSLRGRRVMQEIGEYSHWGISCAVAREVMDKQAAG